MRFFDRLFCILVILILVNRVTGQLCTNRYSSHIYTSNSFDTFTTIATSSNAIMTLGYNYEGHSFIASFSSKGNPLFYYECSPIYQNNRIYFRDLKFTDLIRTKDGYFVAAGKITKDKFAYSEYINSIGVLVKFDRYGNIQWSRKIESANGEFNNGFNLSVSNVLEITNGDLIVYLASDFGKNYYSYGKIVCFSSSGDVKWTTILAAGGYDGSIPGLNTKRALIQSRDNSIIVGDAIYLANRLQSSLNISDAQFHFFSLNPVSGHVNWETNYQFPIPIPLSVTNINNVSELPDGKLAFTSSVSLTGTMQTPAIKKILRITTDNRGRIQNALTYQVPGNKLTELINVMPGNNGLNESFLIRGDTLGAVVNINNSGAITWQQGYSNLNNQFPVNFSASFQNGYAIVMSNFKTHFSKLLLTDGNGQIPCANIPVQLVMDSINMDQGSLLVTDISSIDPNPFAISDFPLHNKSFPLETSTECEEQADCCKDIIDTFNIPNIHICENSTYQLPDGNRVKETGTYFVSFKTSRGCDSIKFYHLYVDKDPLNLKLGNNQCLAGDSLILNATGGFNSYVWMNNPPSADSSFRIFNPGNYHVKVTNSCGTHGDSITVYKECDFPIFLPNSFTPNNDGLNDEFRLPPGNKNHFQSLTIFNRWGQIVFQSNDPFKGWNGSFNHQPLTTDIFIYILVMNGLSGNKITKKGTLLLIR